MKFINLYRVNKVIVCMKFFKKSDFSVSYGQIQGKNMSRFESGNFFVKYEGRKYNLK